MVTRYLEGTYQEDKVILRSFSSIIMKFEFERSSQKIVTLLKLTCIIRWNCDNLHKQTVLCYYWFIPNYFKI